MQRRLFVFLCLVILAFGAAPLVSYGAGRYSNGGVTVWYNSVEPAEPSFGAGGSVARLAFTGDLMAHEWQLNAAYRRETDSYIFTCFEDITPYLTDADYTIGNLETTFAGKDAVYATYPLFNTPDSYGDAMKAAGFDFVTTTNNHCMDKRESGVLRTLEILDALGIGHTGTFASREDADKICIKEVNGIRFALLAYTYGTNGIPVPADKPYLVNLLDENLMRAQITQARKLGADIVIVFPHMGDEYVEAPAPRLVSLARRLCDYGADVIIANHPHVLQPSEVYVTRGENGSERLCFIAYSLGNFISSQRTTPRDASAVFYVEFKKVWNEHHSRAWVTEASFAPTWVLFTNSSGQQDIRVLPVADTIVAAESGLAPYLRGSDLNRLYAVHRETTKTLLGASVPDEEMRPVYTLYSAYPTEE